MERRGRLVVAFLLVAASAGLVAAARVAQARESAAEPVRQALPAGLKRITLAAGCFWCTEADFDGVEGVVATTAGYAGGHTVSPTYTQVSAGGTGHVESVEIFYDPTRTSVEALLEHYWQNVNPFDEHGQFCDYGEQYRPRIFVHDAEQRSAAESSRAAVQARFGRRVVVDIVEAGTFHQAEAGHQDYHRRNPLSYMLYRWGCGRDARLTALQRQAR